MRERNEEMSETRFRVGDVVNCERWDKTVPKSQQLGFQRVTEVLVGQVCQSGVLVKVEGYPAHLDADWLKPMREAELMFEI